MHQAERPLTATRSAVEMGLDNETGECCVTWRPVSVGVGGTGREALEDLRAAAHLGVDLLIDIKLKDIEKED
jgi:hypothetical protein